MININQKRIIRVDSLDVDFSDNELIHINYSLNDIKENLEKIFCIELHEHSFHKRRVINNNLFDHLHLIGEYDCFFAKEKNIISFGFSNDDYFHVLISQFNNEEYRYRNTIHYLVDQFDSFYEFLKIFEYSKSNML